MQASSAAALRVFSAQRGGLVTGPGNTVSVNGSTLSFAPAVSWQAGETVQVALTSAAQTAGGQALAVPRVWQFTAAVSPQSPGTFPGGGSTLNMSGGSNLTDVAPADVDGDGDLDLLTLNETDQRVEVSINLGGGAFGVGMTVPLLRWPRALAVGDVDGDGDLDFVVPYFQPSLNHNIVSVHLNNGQGTFSRGADLILDYELVHVALGDVDGDGDLDMVVAKYLSSNTVYVRFNNGAGVFSGGSQLNSVGANPYHVVLGDIDNDGDLDLAVTNFFQPGSGNVTIYRNNGSGVFAISSNVVVGAYPTSSALNDIDHDGDLDLLTIAAGSNTRVVDLRLNDGTGQFGGGYSLPVSGGIRSMSLGDVDGDGDPDLLLGSSRPLVPPPPPNFSPIIGTVELYKNDGAGTFGPVHAVMDVGNTYPIQLVNADMDGDGDLDFIAVGTNVGFGQVVMRLNGGTVAATGHAGLAEQLVVHPNPAHHRFACSLPAVSGAKAATLILRNAQGQVVKNSSCLLPATTAEMSVADLAPGLYLLQVQVGKLSTTRRLVLE
ncbi:hypothetical protein GCM10023185_14930 [Hymenobacter saemangeumensis]|uniref:T9SS type A sorting domain-containing protein n=1 Tax=Hymenobacter saemangeumensis TaxID=1084522 RepID=A0ABP8I911_9BACT